VHDDLDAGIQRANPLARRLELGPSHVRSAIDDLTVQVAGIDYVEINDAQRADAGRRQVHGGWRTQASGPDANHARGFQLALPLDADLRHDQMPAVSLDLLVRQLRRFLRRRNVRPSGNRGHDADRVARLEAGLLAVQMPDIFVVHVHVHEAPQPAIFSVEVAAEIAVLRDEAFEDVADSAAFDLDDILTAGERPERCRNQYPVGHGMS
jgi:hypothetical protein